MRPGTRSSAQSYKQQQQPEQDNSSDYASSPPEGLGIEYDGRETVRLQRFEASSQYNGNTIYTPTSPLRSQNINTDIPRRTHQPVTSIRQLPLEEDSNSAAEESSSLLPRSNNKPNLRDGRVRIRPWGCSLVSFILACLSLVFLGIVAHSFLNLQRDPKGCKMSFMYPSYAKLSDFDTEHTRFATKYSLYLYREQKMDLSMEVLFHVEKKSANSCAAEWSAGPIHPRKRRELSPSPSHRRRSSLSILPRIPRKQQYPPRRHPKSRLLHR